jgi:uncharacterized membrane protein
MHLAMTIFNGLATVFALVAIIIGIYTGTLAMVALNLVLFLVNFYFMYTHYLHHRRENRKHHDRT